VQTLLYQDNLKALLKDSLSIIQESLDSGEVISSETINNALKQRAIVLETLIKTRKNIFAQKIDISCVSHLNQILTRLSGSMMDQDAWMIDWRLQGDIEH
jgi:hypothetical protein